MKRHLLLVAALAAASAFAYTVQVDTASLQVTPATTPALAGYDVVTLAGAVALPVEPGQPNLPAVAVTLALPSGTEIESVEVARAEAATVPGTYNVLPFQAPTPVGSAAPAVTPPDAATYASTAPFPGKLAYSFQSGNMSGYHIGSVILAPVQYVPATGKLLIYSSVDFDLKLRRADGDYVYPKVRLKWVDDEIRERLAATVINPGEISPPPGMKLLDAAAAGGRDAGVYPYLIITNSTMESTAQTLADWKTKKGLNAAVVTTSYIGSNYSGVDTAEKIRNCIKDYYQNNGTEYVFLAGTHAVIPVRKVYDPQYNTMEGDHLIPTDNYYGCLDGTFNADNDNRWGEYPDDNVDWTYDVYVGRAQVSTANDLAEVVDKTLCYEGADASSETNPYNYQNQAILAGGFLDASTNEKVLMEYIRDNYLTASYWNFTELWDNNYPGGGVFNRSNFISHMNAGKGIIAHAMHSNTTLIGTNSGSVYSSDLHGLTNHPKFFGFLNTLGCYDGNTDRTDNCAAYFVSAANGGGVGFVGNTRYGWYSPGSPAAGYSADFQKEYFHQFGTNDIYVSGQTFAFHKHALQSTITNTTYRYIYFELMLTGDPDIWVPTNNVYALQVNYDAGIPTGPQSYDVHVGDATDGNVAGALVCVWKGTEVYAFGTTDTGGNISFNINPTTTGTMSLTVSAHNRETFEADVQVGTTDIELASFDGRRLSTGVLLSWTVNSGGNAEYFNLYRQPLADGAATAAGASPAGAPSGGVATAKGNAATADVSSSWTKVNAEPITGKSPYKYFDRGVAAGEFEYKLEAVANDAAQELGTTRVAGTVPASFALTIAPNPVRSVAKFTLGLPAASTVKLTLYDLSGRKVKELLTGALPAGEHTVRADLSRTAAGVYFVRYAACDEAATKRLVVVR